MYTHQGNVNCARMNQLFSTGMLKLYVTPPPFLLSHIVCKSAPSPSPILPIRTGLPVDMPVSISIQPPCRNESNIEQIWRTHKYSPSGILDVFKNTCVYDPCSKWRFQTENVIFILRKCARLHVLIWTGT